MTRAVVIRPAAVADVLSNKVVSLQSATDTVKCVTGQGLASPNVVYSAGVVLWFLELLL